VLCDYLLAVLREKKMHKTPQLHRHAARRPHAKISISHGADASIRDRMRACVSADRFEALTEMSDTSCQSDEQLADRLLLLNAVQQDSALIREGLHLCERIVKAVADHQDR
jgi:hypothetical protein